jgi:hypothetical protein
MRMLEEILSDAVEHKIMTQGKADLRSAETFLVDNVAEYLYAQSTKEIWDVKSDFPCLAPPFPQFWMEYSRPSNINSATCGIQSSRFLPYRVGLWFRFMESRNAWQELAAWRSPEDLKQDLAELKVEMNKFFTPEVAEELGDPLQWRDLGNPRRKQLTKPARIFLALADQYRNVLEFTQPGAENRFQAMSEASNIRWIGSCRSFVQTERHGRVYGPLAKQVLGISETGAVLKDVCLFGTRQAEMANWDEAGAAISTLWFPGLLDAYLQR